MVLVEKGIGEATVWVYAYIGSWEFDGEMVARLLIELADMQTIKFRMHSYGGEVIEGNVIFNAIAAAPQRTELQIDGLCASMAAIISQAFDYVTIVDNGYMMIHNPSGGAYGNAGALESAAKLLRDMEAQFKKMFAKHTGKPETDTAQWMDGQDHWLTPQEALDAGLVDAIVPSITEAPDEFTLETVVALGPKAAYTRFAATLEESAKPKPNTNSSKMNKQALIDKYKLTGVTKDTPDEEFQTALEAHIDGLDTKAKDSETEKEETIEEMITAATGTKITAKQAETFRTIGKTSGVKALAGALDAIKPFASISGRIGAGTATGKPAEAKKDWDWSKYQKEDPKALATLQKTNFEAFADLYEAEYGTRPQA